MNDPIPHTLLIEGTASIVAALAGAGRVNAGDIPGLIGTTYGALRDLGAAPPEPVELKPAVPIRQSVRDDFIVCLEDGKKFKSLKRHLRTHYDLSPEEYREKWGLPADYPMVSPNYSAVRSKLAKDTGLGTKPGRK